MKCKADGCERDAMYVGKGVCQKHYFRLRRGRPLEDRPRGVPFLVDPRGYLGVFEPGHPLALGNGVVAVHRKMLFDAVGGVVSECELCKKPLTWASCHVDHIDENPGNNAIGNLRPLCMDCNVKRTRSIDRRGATVLVVGDERKTLAEWSRDSRVSVCVKTIIERKKRGVSDAEALFGKKRTHNGNRTERKRPYRPILKHEHAGLRLTLAEWSRQPGVTVSDATLHNRLRAGWSLEAALFTPATDTGAAGRRLRV